MSRKQRNNRMARDAAGRFVKNEEVRKLSGITLTEYIGILTALAWTHLKTFFRGLWSVAAKAVSVAWKGCYLFWSSIKTTFSKLKETAIFSAIIVGAHTLFLVLTRSITVSSGLLHFGVAWFMATAVAMALKAFARFVTYVGLAAYDWATANLPAAYYAVKHTFISVAKKVVSFFKKDEQAVGPQVDDRRNMARESIRAAC